MFKECFKNYKSKCPPPDFSDVVDFRCSKQVHLVKEVNPVSEVHLCGLKPVSEWKVRRVEGRPGLIHVENPFTSVGHRYWICRSLSAYTKHPHCRLNLDAFDELKEGQDWWEVSNRETDSAKKLQKGLRWSTLGYHHDWDSKVYSENARDPFPEDLAALSKRVAEALGFADFLAQAAIVNFYHQGSTLAGHTDHSEKNFSAPLLSFSFGCSAVFLLGGKSLDDKPTAMFLHSGDLVVMSGESRLSYHGVPKILPRVEYNVNVAPESELCNECSLVIDPNVFTKCVDNIFWTPFKSYVLHSRINLNVRQVLFPEESKLCS